MACAAAAPPIGVALGEASLTRDQRVVLLRLATPAVRRTVSTLVASLPSAARHISVSAAAVARGRVTRCPSKPRCAPRASFTLLSLAEKGRPPVRVNRRAAP